MRTTRFPLFLIVVLAVSALALAGQALAADHPAPVQKAIERLAKVAEVEVADIEVVSCEFVTWPDTSLGAPRPGYVYAQVLTGGYKVVLLAKGRRYEYHTDTRNRVVLANSGDDEGEGAAAPSVAVPNSMAAKCCADLAQRLKIKPEAISIGKTTPATFLDGSLGFPRPGEVYTKAITQGERLTLVYRNREYLYAANDTVIRYGGPADARDFSAVYIEPIENEPNMNGNLVQVALAGDNPRVLLSGVDNCRPQADGSIIGMRRTSRSGYDLLYLAPKTMGEGVRLASGLYFVDAAVTPDGKRWGAIYRPGLGSGWKLITGPVAGPAEGEPVALPDGLPMPQRLYLHMPHPVVRVLREGVPVHYELVDGNWKPVQFDAPETEEMLMSRSTSLNVTTKEVDGKPVTEVVTLWWHGQRDPIATIPGFAATEVSLTPGRPFLLLSGKSGEEHQAYTVDIVTGEVLATAAGAQGPVRLMLAPSASPITMVGH